MDSSGNVNGGADGYTFGPGEMVTEFEEGTTALAVGEISQPIQSDYGYTISSSRLMPTMRPARASTRT